ncbi:MAG TPA: response regulator transcription factor [Blastocatellia bacterium]|nr:response regulator transcription factor [Blastocatellia bacterium]
MKVLVVEDYEPMRRTIRSFIEDFAQSVLECSNGAEAVAQYSEHRPDWVLMDIKMGDVDGLAATRQIVAAFPDARVVMVTSYDEQGLRDEAHLAGACGYVLKENLRELASILSGEARSGNSL